MSVEAGEKPRRRVEWTGPKARLNRDRINHETLKRHPADGSAQ